MAVPTTITDLSTTANSNSPAGSEVPSSGNGPDEYIRALGSIVRVMRAKGSDVASATTTDLGAATTGDFVHVTGTTTITGLGTVAAGIKKIVTFDGALTLTHNGTSLILPGAANITTAAGDVAVFVSEGAGNWRCVSYVKANGGAVAVAAGSVVAASLAYAAVNGQTAETAPAIDDELLIGDTSGSDLNKMTFANFLKVVNGLTEDASPDSANDFVLTYDTSASAAKKVKPSNLSSYTPSASNALSGSIVQVVNVQDGAYATGSTAIPYDNSIPQNTEGDQYMSLAITPNSATNKLKITVTVFGGEATNTSDYWTVALFQDSIANALAAGSGRVPTSAGSTQVTFTHYMTAGTTSATTFKVRAGLNTANTFEFNGFGGARLYGGVCASSITIEEIKV